MKFINFFFILCLAFTFAAFTLQPQFKGIEKAKTYNDRQDNLLPWQKAVTKLLNTIAKGNVNEFKQIIHFPFQNPMPQGENDFWSKSNEIWVPILGEMVHDVDYENTPLTEEDFQQYFDKLFPRELSKLIAQIDMKILFEEAFVERENITLKEQYSEELIKVNITYAQEYNWLTICFFDGARYSNEENPLDFTEDGISACYVFQLEGEKCTLHHVYIPH